MKVIRIVYPSMYDEKETYDDRLRGAARKLLKGGEHEDDSKVTKSKIVIAMLGMSLVNSQAREICYTSISNLRFSHQKTLKLKKVSFKAGEVQIDNQLLRQNDAIILKREQSMRGFGEFLSIKCHIVTNDAIENL